VVARALVDPWLWAFLAAVGWGACCGIVGTTTLGRRLPFGLAAFVLAEAPRVVLPLPFVVQPRLGVAPPALWVVGGIVLGAALVFGLPVRRIVPLTALMVCDVLWPLGLSLMFGSVLGIALTPVWLLLAWTLTHLEEESLLREYGDAYRALQERVPRLLPRLPALRRR